LSFLTVGGLALYLHPVEAARHPAAKYFLEFARMSLVAFVASAPLVAYHFGTVSVAALPANLLLGSSATFVIISAFSAHLVSFVFPALASLVMSIFAGPMSGWILWL